jgi:hypothetical protein
LPKPEDLKKYSREALQQLREQLQKSIPERIRKTTELGSDFGHAERQGDEQKLLQQLDKLLGGS